MRSGSPRTASTPGWPDIPAWRGRLDEKLALLETTLADIAARFACVPFCEQVASLGGPPAPERL